MLTYFVDLCFQAYQHSFIGQFHCYKHTFSHFHSLLYYYAALFYYTCITKTNIYLMFTNGIVKLFLNILTGQNGNNIECCQRTWTFMKLCYNGYNFKIL